MNDEKKFETWLSGVCKRALPANEMTRAKVFAKELAEGVAKGFWPNHVIALPIGAINFYEIFTTESKYSEADFKSIINNINGPRRFVPEYIRARWYKNYFPIELLRINHYLNNNNELTKSAFDLLEEVEPVTIFISYKRRESSAFAMYVLTRLKMEGLEAFVDMTLIPGEDWHAGLKERIKEYDYLIALIGKETLKSDVCMKEIGWAIEAGITIIPVWHNEFKYKSGDWNIREKIDRVLNATHSIQVKEESASGYNTAIVELLNRFGISP